MVNHFSPACLIGKPCISKTVTDQGEILILFFGSILLGAINMPQIDGPWAVIFARDSALVELLITKLLALYKVVKLRFEG